MTTPRRITIAALAIAFFGCSGPQDLSRMTIRSQKTDDHATRSVHARVRNTTTAALYLHNVDLKTGVMKTPPPPTIEPGGSGEFLAESAGTSAGVEGSVDYRVGSAAGPRADFYFDNPYRGDSTVGCSAPSGYTATHEWRGDENARVTYTLRDRKVD